VTRLFDATDHWFGFDERDVWTLFHSFAFDFSVWELWGALLHGGRLVVVPYLVSRSPERFLEVLAQERVTVLNQTPSAFRQLVQADGARGSAPVGLALRYVIFGGEALDLQSLRPWIERRGDDRPQLVNMYGITETTVHVSYRRIEREDVEGGAGSVIGVPIPDLCIRVLDAQGEPVPIGVPGEMYVGGAGVARGYLNRAELTAARFVRDAFSEDAGARLYRSGDLARRLENGDLEYLGRIDHQVKIRGFRVELGEIEAALSQQPEVREAVVVVRDEAGGDRRLVAYVVGSAEASDLGGELRVRLRQLLPEYMVPSAFVLLDRLPLNQNGKVDKKALPAPGAPGGSARDRVPPRGPVEEAVAAVWKEVLGLESVSVHDNFFDLGGHSMLAARLLGRLHDAFAVDVPLRSLFQQPTVAGLADVIQALQWIDQSGRATTTGTREEVEI
jgi:acyl-coenzyme A synthetase/AMP-(fatty) acid ligase/acyl carrier protein